MSANRYLARVSGRLQEVVAAVTGGTAAQAGQLVALDDAGRIDPTILPNGVGQDVVSGTGAAALTAGDLVALSATGYVRASGAAGASQAQAVGFVLATTAANAPVAVFYDGINTSRTGLTVGTRYYLSDTSPGQITDTPVSGTGKLHQFVGVANTTTSLVFKPDDGIVLA